MKQKWRVKLSVALLLVWAPGCSKPREAIVLNKSEKYQAEIIVESEGWLGMYSCLLVVSSGKRVCLQEYLFRHRDAAEDIKQEGVNVRLESNRVVVTTKGTWCPKLMVREIAPGD